MNWYCEINGTVLGPVMESELESLWLSGRLTGATFVWREGLPGWTPAGQIWPAMLTMTPPAMATQEPTQASAPFPSDQFIPKAEARPRAEAAAAPPQGGKYDRKESNSWLDQPAKPSPNANPRLQGLYCLIGGLVALWAGIGWPLHEAKTGAPTIMYSMKFIIFAMVTALLGIYMLMTGRELSQMAAAKYSNLAHGSINKVPLSMWLCLGVLASICAVIIWYVDSMFAKLGYQ